MAGRLLARIRRLLGLGGRDKPRGDGVDERGDSGAETSAADDRDQAGPGEFNPFPEPVVIEFRDVLDLHSIPARLVKSVVEDYIDEAHRRGVRQVRIIHGKGIGVQREMVRSILARSEFVADFDDAPAEAGGWGATIARLR
jgi:hypothetical protein